MTTGRQKIGSRTEKNLHIDPQNVGWLLLLFPGYRLPNIVDDRAKFKNVQGFFW
jgi:hypothetical protein